MGRISPVFDRCFTSSTYQAPVVQKVDNVIHRINNYPLDSAIHFPNTYPQDRDFSGR